MTDLPRNQIERKTQRYTLRNGEQLSVVVTCVGGDGRYEGKAIDLSKGGTKVVLAAALPINAKVNVRLFSEKRKLDISITGHVCWTRPQTRQRWWVGLAFERDLDNEQFASFAKAGFIERRRDPRHVHDVAAKARLELESRCIDVRIQDLSAGGVKLLAPERANVGDRLLLEMHDDDESSVLAKVVWREEIEDGFG